MSMVVNLDDYVSAVEAADLLGINYSALWARIKRGQIETLKIGRFHLIKKSIINNQVKEYHDNTEGLVQATG